MLSPPSSSVLEDEIAIANIKEEIGLGDQEGDEQLPFEFWICTERHTVPDSNILRASWYNFHEEEKTLGDPLLARALLQAVAIRSRRRGLASLSRIN